MHFSIARLSFIAAPVLVLALLGAGCEHRDETIQPQFADGAIFVSIVDGQGKDLGGIGKVTYLARGKKQLRSDSAAFTGMRALPVHVIVDKDELDLVGIELATADKKPRATISAADLAHWIPVAKKGVLLELTIAGDASQGATFSMRATPPLTAVADRTVRQIPEGIFVATDFAAALSALRYAASATESYHKDLAALVARQESLTAAQLDLALDGVYFTQTAIDELQVFLHSYEEQHQYAEFTRESTAALGMRASANHELAGQLAPLSNALLDDNLAKVSDLSFENGMHLLGKLITMVRAEPGTAAFKALSTTVKLTGEQKLAVARLAQAKLNRTAVRDLLLDWFATDNARSVTGLGAQLANFTDGGYRNAIILGAFNELTTLTPSDLATLASWITNGDSEAVRTMLTKGATLIDALTTAELLPLMGPNGYWAAVTYPLFFGKVTDLNAHNAAAIAALLSGDTRRDLVLSYLGKQKTLLTADFTSLVALLEGDLRDTTILDWLPRVTERDAGHLAQLFGLLSPGARATNLLRFIDAIPSLDTEALIALSQAAPERSSFILLAYLDRLTDFTPANAVKLARRLSDRDKDSVLLLAMERAKTVTSDDLYAVASAAYEKGTYLLQRNLTKIAPLTAAGVVNLTRLFNDYSRDEFVLKSIELLGTVQTAELIALSGATYNRGQYVLVHYEDHVSDLTVENTIQLARRLSGTDQDQVVKFWFTKNAALKTQELIALAAASYYSGSRIMLEQLEKVSDLTVDNAITIVSRMNGGDQDAFLLKAVDLVTDLSSDNLLKLANRAYSRRDAVIQKGVERLSRHPQ